jgi:hypothetical protein
MFVMMKCGVLFEVRAEFLNIIQTSFGFIGLMKSPRQLVLDTPLMQVVIDSR